MMGQFRFLLVTLTNRQEKQILLTRARVWQKQWERVFLQPFGTTLTALHVKLTPKA